MNISDFVERSNPEDWDDDFEPILSQSGTRGDDTAGKVVPKAGNTAKQLFIRKNVLILLILILTSAASFGLGILVGQGSVASTANGGGLITGAAPGAESSTAALNTAALGAVSVQNSTTNAPSGTPEGGEVIGSSNTRQYYLSWCPEASKIAKADTVWFATEQMAKSAGYTAGACPGL